MKNELVALLNSEEITVLGKPAETLEDKKTLANALVSPDYSLKDFINNDLWIKNYYCEPVIFSPDENGEVKEGIRTVLISTEGKSYACAARGVVTALKNITQIFGSAEEWTEPIHVEVKSVSLGKASMLTLRLL